MDVTTRVKKAAQAVADLGITPVIIPHETSGRATADAAEVLNVDPSLILKMMILVDKKTGNNVGALLRGDERIDQKKLRAATGLKTLRFAKPEEVTQITGYVIGGVPPIALSQCEKRCCSVRILEVEFVYGSGGSEFHAMKVSPSDLQKIPGVTWTDLAAPDSTKVQQ